MVDGGVQHYFPAGLIGRFGEPPRPSKPKTRHRKVWAVAQGTGEVRRPQKAETYGRDLFNPRLYDTAEDAPGKSMLDDHLSRGEKVLHGMDDILESIKVTGCVTLSTYILKLVPMVACLLIRHPWVAPHNAGPLTHDLEANSLSAKQRQEAWCKLVRLLTYDALWQVVTPASGEVFVTSDIGYAHFMGSGWGQLFVPIDQNHAFLISHGARTYYYGQPIVPIDSEQFNRAWQRELTGILVRTAPRFVFCPSEAVALVTSQMVLGDGDIGVGLPAELLMHPQVSAVLLTSSTRGDAMLSYELYHASHELIGCNCRDSMKGFGANRQDIRRFERMRRRNRRELIDSLPSASPSLVSSIAAKFDRVTASPHLSRTLR